MGRNTGREFIFKAFLEIVHDFENIKVILWKVIFGR